MVWLFSVGVIAGVYRSLSLFIVVILWMLVRAWVLRTAQAWLAIALAMACAVIGWAAIEHADAGRAIVSHAATRAGGRALPLRGWVASFPQSGRYGSSFDFATRVDGRAVRLALRAGRFDVSYGETLEVDARLSTTTRTPSAYLTSRGLAGEGRARFQDVRRSSIIGPRAGGTHGCPLLRHVLWPMHRAARTTLARALGGDAALPVGLLLGERSMLDRAAYEAVRSLGIAHLLALSGMHLTMIAALALAASRWTPRHRDAWIAFALSIYVGVVGSVDSLTRAYVMALLILAARALLRPARPVDSLGKALLLMLLVEPCSILSVGLQLSFAATLAVLLCLERLPRSLVRAPAPSQPRWRRVLIRFGRGAAAAFVVSLVVEVFIAPLQLHHFGRISVVGPVATVVFMAPVSILQVMALAASVDLPLVHNPLAAALAWSSSATRDAIVAAGSLAPHPIAVPRPAWLVYYAAIAVAGGFLLRPRAQRDAIVRRNRSGR